MKTKSLPVIILLSFLAIKCELTRKDEYYHLPQSTRSLLKTGDTLLYINNGSKTDTLFVFQKLSSVHRISLSGSSCKTDPSAYFELELVYLVKKKDDGCSNPLYEIKEFDDCENDYHCDRSILIVVSATDGGKIKSSNGNIPLPIWYGFSLRHSDSLIRSMTILNHVYDSVFYYKSDNIQKTDSVREIYYSYKYGIVQMNLSDDTLKRVKK